MANPIASIAVDPKSLRVPMPPRVEQQDTKNWQTALVILVCCAIYLPVMGLYGMFDPWETHYTEVARQFMVRGDWLSTYWHNGTGPDGFSETNFWSKPVGSFWMSGLSLKLFGYGAHTTGEQIATGSIEWAVRLPFFLTALFGIFCVYLMAARLFGRRAGLLSAAVLATAPMYFMIGRQAMTDMPYVGPMSGGVALFMLGLFGAKEVMPRKSVKFGRFTLSWPHASCYYIFLAAFVIFMVLQLTAIIGPLRRIPMPVKAFNGKLSLAIWMIPYAVLAAVFIFLSRKTKTKNEVYIYGFYMSAAVAGLSKGLIGSLQPGLFALAYVAVAREWRLLKEMGIFRGLMVAVCIAFPWYTGMVVRHGRAFWNMFFGTEQFRRLTIGEQKQAVGTIEYYLQQMGYGLFPWIAFLPASLVRVFTTGKERTPRDRAKLFVGVWLVCTVCLFTWSLTKYHHYILPAIPPAAILIALYLDELLDGKVVAINVSMVSAIGVMLVVGIDLIRQPAQWVWMYTYLYDGNWAKGVPQGPLVTIYTVLCAAALLPFFWAKLRKWAVVGFVAVAVFFGGYVLNWYQVGCAKHWSQKYVLKTYYKLRKSPEEKLVAWQFNWRGETWYTGAEVVVSKSLENEKIQAWLKERKGTRFFFITERYRFSRLRQMMPTESGKKTLKIVDDSNVHYVLAQAEI